MDARRRRLLTLALAAGTSLAAAGDSAEPDDAEVYSAFFRLVEVDLKERVTIVVDAETAGLDVLLGPETVEEFRARSHVASREAVSDLLARSRRSRAVRLPASSLPANLRVISATSNDLDDIFLVLPREAQPRAFKKRFGGAQTIVSLSRVGYAPSGEAIFCIATRGLSLLGGMASLVTMRRGPQGWQLVRDENLWVS